MNKKNAGFVVVRMSSNGVFKTASNALSAKNVKLIQLLDNPDIPKSTNALESFFGHLKQNIAIHRGLSKEHYKNYIKWYLFFKSNETTFDRTK